MRGGACRVEFESVYDTTGFGAINLGRLGAISEVQGHQGLEPRPGWQRIDNALPVGQGLRSCGDRRFQVGHLNGARELRGCEGQHGAQRGSVPQVQMPVIGTADGERTHFRRPAWARMSCLKMSSSAYRTPNPVMSVLMCASPPVRVAEDRSTWAQAMSSGTKRLRNRVARM